MKRYKELLEQFVAFKTISAQVEYKSEIDKCVTWLDSTFTKYKFVTQIHKTCDNPIFLAKYVVDISLPTILIYGHYDVQPAMKAEGWYADPFKLFEKGDRLYARGVVDNKGQVMIHIATIFDLIEANTLAYNVTFLLEGNEETGGNALTEFIKMHVPKADAILISDGEIPYEPLIDVSTRGCVNMTVTLTTNKTDLHSGLYGGVMPNAAFELSKLLSTLQEQKPLKSYSYKPSKNELLTCQKLDKIKQKKESLPDNFTQNTAFSSSIEISGIQSGYNGPGYNNIVPHEAIARLNIRFAPGINARKATYELIQVIRSLQSDQAEIALEVTEINDGAKIITDSLFHKRAMMCLSKVFKKKPLENYCGATIPIIPQFISLANLHPIMVSLGNSDCNMHAVNENFSVPLLKKGLAFSQLFFSK